MIALSYILFWLLCGFVPAGYFLAMLKHEPLPDVAKLLAGFLVLFGPVTLIAMTCYVLAYWSGMFVAFLVETMTPLPPPEKGDPPTISHLSFPHKEHPLG